MKAKVEHGAKIIHVDPRFTRTSSVADIYAPVRAGSDIAFLGGIIKYVIDSDKWNSDPFFKSFVVNYTNAATIIGEDFKDTEELNGVFSGLLQSKGGVHEWPFNGLTHQYDGASWQYARTKVGAQGEAAAPPRVRRDSVSRARRAEGRTQAAQAAAKAPQGPPFDALVASLDAARGPARRDATESTNGLPNRQKAFRALHAGDGREEHRLPEGNLSQSRRDHSGQFRRGPHDLVRLCRCLDAAHLRRANHRRLRAASASAGQFRPARRRLMALRGHASIQGSTDVPTLYHSIHGYMPAPTALKKHDTLHDYLAAETLPTGYWANMPKFVVSYLKSIYGDAATQENQFGWDWHPKILGDHSHMAMFVAMNAGRVKGMFCVGQNPATSLNAKLERVGAKKARMAGRERQLAAPRPRTFGRTRRKSKSGEVKTADIKTEVFFFPPTRSPKSTARSRTPSACCNFITKPPRRPAIAGPIPGSTYDLGKRLKKLYAHRPRRAIRDLKTSSGTTRATTPTSARWASLRR